MGLFSDILMDNETIFRDESVLDFAYVPYEMPERENEMQEIAFHIKPLLQNRRGSNLFIYGQPGLGKTATIKYVFNELKNSTEEVIPIYINCWQNQTTHAIAIAIAKHVNLIYPPKGVPTEEILNTTFKRLEDKGVVICLDEIDKVREMNIIYNLMELDRISIFLITNNPKYKTYIEPRLISRLNLTNLEFKPYTTKEMKNIISRRAKQAFRPGVISEEIIHEIAINSGTDVRKAITIMLNAGRLAEKDASKKIKLEHIRKVINSMRNLILDELNKYEKRILEIIKENPKIISGKAYEIYKEKYDDLSIRSFRRYVNRLIKQGLIKVENTGEGFQGRSRYLEVINGI